MATSKGNRETLFLAIEKKHGEKVTVWFKRLKDLDTTKYLEQIAFLRENYGFSQAHANAIVMYHRGSKSSNRFGTPNNYFKSVDPRTTKTIKKIFAAIMAKHKDLELVIAWNQPMLRRGKDYIIGVWVGKDHLLLNLFSNDVLKRCSTRLNKFEVNKFTFRVPLDWKVDTALIQALAKARIAELKS